MVRPIPLFCLACALCLVAETAVTQTRAPAQPQPRAGISIRDASAFPGGEFTLPIELNLGAAEADLFEVAFKVVVPEATMFRSVERSYALEEAGGSARGAAALEGGQTVITVTLKAGQRPLPRDVVAYIVLGVKADAMLGDRRLRIADATVKDKTGAAVEPVQVTSATLAVIDPKSTSIAACFFYMH